MLTDLRNLIIGIWGKGVKVRAGYKTTKGKAEEK